MKTTIVAVLLLLTSFAPAKALPLDRVIHFHDYLNSAGDLNCSNDVTAQLKQAQADWLTMVRARTGGEFDAGAGCYLLSAPVHIGDASGQGVGGNWHGEDSNTTRFKAASPDIDGLLRFDDFWWGQGIHDFSVSGVEHGHGKGIVFGAQHQDLGTCCVTISNVRSDHWHFCTEFGDEEPPYGAAAELTINDLVTSECDRAVTMSSWNTIDLTFTNPHWSNSQATPGNFGIVNCIIGCAQHISVQGGSSVWTKTDFAIYSGPAQISNFRAESETQTTTRVMLGQDKYILEGNTFSSTNTQAPIAITCQCANGGSLILRNNYLNGRVQITDKNGSVDSYGNWISGNQPFELQQLPVLLRSFGDEKVDPTNINNHLGFWPEVNP